MDDIKRVYKYSVARGAGKYSQDVTLKSAIKIMARLSSGPDDDFEIERVMDKSGYRMYWRWRNGKWSKAWHTFASEKDLDRWRCAVTRYRRNDANDNDSDKTLCFA